MIHQVMSILPHVVVDNCFRRRYENSATVKVIMDRLSVEGPPVIMDPPPLKDQSEGVNNMLDMLYEKKLKTTVHSKKFSTPLSSLVLVLSHEMQNLALLNTTSLSKTVVVFHSHQAGDESAELRNQIDQDMLMNSKSYSSIFRTLLPRLNIEALRNETNAANAAIKNSLKTNFQKSSEDLASFTRVFNSNAVILGGLKLWLESIPIAHDETNRIVDITREFLIKSGIIPVITSIDLGAKGRAKLSGSILSSSGQSKDELEDILANYLSQLETRDFFEVVAFFDTDDVAFSKII